MRKIKQFFWLSFIFLLSLGIFSNTYAAYEFEDKSLYTWYTLYWDITNKQYPWIIQYWDDIINALTDTSSKYYSKDQAIINIWNNNEAFYFSSNWFPSVKTDNFSVNNNLLNLWQSWEESIKENLVNKFKFSIYTKLFQAMKNTYAYNNAIAKPNFPASINDKYYTNAEGLKNSVAYTLLNSNTGSISSMGYLWQEPEIAPAHYYTKSQHDRYLKFESSILKIAWKVNNINNTNTLNKLETALLKILKDWKKKTKNETFLKYMIIYQMILDKKQ